MSGETDTLIVGAGPAGLAAGAVLRRANVPFVILERAQHVGESWRRHYDRIHLHTPNISHHCPIGHSRMRIRGIRRGSRSWITSKTTPVRSTSRRSSGLEVQRFAAATTGYVETFTNAGNYQGRHIIIATGYNRAPNVPRWPGQETFTGPVIHSSEYKNAETFRGQRVLVVGFGNSGAEIALDLAEHSARCTIAVRGKVNVVPREVLGIPITYSRLRHVRSRRASRTA